MSDTLPVTHPQAAVRAARALHEGQLVVLPTDTVYGVAAHPAHPQALIALYAAKGRPPQKAIPILLSDIAAAEQVTLPLSQAARKLAEAFWPGPLTLVVPKRDDLSPLISTLNTVGVRVPGHAVTRAVIAAAGGALAVTSANRSGKENPVTATEAAAQLGETITLYLDGGTCSGGLPSTVVAVPAVGDALRILRPGPIGAPALQEVLGAGVQIVESAAP